MDSRWAHNDATAEEVSWPGSEFEVLWRSDAGPQHTPDSAPTVAAEQCDRPQGPLLVSGGPLSAEMVSSLLSSGSIECDLDTEALQTQLKRVLLQNAQLREVVRRSTSSLRQQCDVLTQWRDDNARLREQRRQVAGQCQRARDVVLQLRRENTALQQQLAQRQQQHADGDVGDAEVQLRSQLSRAETQLRDLRLEVDRQRSKLERQRAELTAYRAETPAPPVVPTGGSRDSSILHQRLVDAASAVTEAQQLAVARPADIGAVVARLESVRTALLDGSLPTADTVDGSQAHDRAQPLPAAAAEQQRHAASLDAAEMQRQQVSMDGLQARILSMEELLVARGTECERLQRQLIQARRDLSAVDILKAQVDVYQQDFNQERQQREQLATERDQLRQQLQLLQCRQPSNSLVTPAEQWTTLEPEVSPPAHVSPPPAVYTCPKCEMGFLDVQPLENHVNRCLDEDEQTA